MAVAKSSTSPNNRGGSSGSPRTEWGPIEALRANPKNARMHSKKQIPRIAASIRQFGFLNPLIVDDANVVLAGHGWLEAARLEGWSEVPVFRFGHLSEAQKRACVIADNKIAEQAGWDREILALEPGELIDLLPTEDLDVSLTGFEVAEIDLLMAESTSRLAPEDAVVPAPSGSGHRSGRSVASWKTSGATNE
jgi:ParB-like chromosome segregation protein Spo0J